MASILQDGYDCIKICAEEVGKAFSLGIPSPAGLERRMAAQPVRTERIVAG
jgi:hypothetical protein